MKFIKNSSAINATDISINFNINEISSILNETSFEKWIQLNCLNQNQWSIDL